jgi:ACT domain-containing protein
MADEELIYRITRAVYGRLGAPADEGMVEGLVTDVYKAVAPLVAPSESSERSAPRTQGSSRRLIVTVFGVDRPGIMAAVTQILADAECSIVDIDQTVVQGKFAMVLIAEMTHARETASTLKERFRQEGERLGVRIYSQREDLFNAMHRI